MSYQDLIKLALKGRSVNGTAKAWGVPQRALDRYTKGDLPNFKVAMKIAEETGISAEEVLRTLAAEEQARKQQRTVTEKISANFEKVLSLLNPRRSLILAR